MTLDEFQSTRPLRGATPRAGKGVRAISISIHAPLAGRDERGRSCNTPTKLFQSTRPLRGATEYRWNHCHARMEFQSTRPLRGATPRMLRQRRITILHFNPRAPCGARRPRRRFLWQDQGEFQSTRPLRGATSNHLGEELTNLNFNPRAPCGARLITWMGQLLDFYISIHAPLAGRDGYWL